MDPIKDLPTFVETAGQVHASHGAHALLLGDGRERPRVAALVADRKLTHVIHMPGWRADVVAWLKSADVLVLPSRTEGCSNVMLEAMASGCAMVASDIAPCRDLISPGRHGALCYPGAVGEFVAACQALIDQKEKRCYLSTNARERVERLHSLPSVVDLLARIYRSSVGKPDHGR